MSKTLTPEEEKFIADAYKFAQENYEDWGDVIVECYSDDEILKLGTLEEVKRAGIDYAEYRSEIQSTAW